MKKRDRLYDIKGFLDKLIKKRLFIQEAFAQGFTRIGCEAGFGF